MQKRTFLKQLSVLTFGLPTAGSLERLISRHEHIPPDQLAADDDFWQRIRAHYKIKPDYINLENGYYCILPEATMEKHIERMRDVNYHGSYYMRTVQFENKKTVAGKLARLAGCAEDELIITRNSTESLDMIIGGLDWKAGDEAVMAEQDYGAMLDMFDQVGKRYGVINRRVSIPNHPDSDEEIVNLYAQAITPKTRLLMVCHIINITGQILPIRKICDMARSKGVQVMVDGAHAFAHFQYSIADLNCDYYGTSLHKWLSAPLGAGFLYVRRDNISKVWPVFAEAERKPDDISRLNHTGTLPVHTDLAITDAIDYHLMIGAERKEQRLRYLQTYWTQKVRDLPHVQVNTPKDPKRYCGIGNVAIKGIAPAVLAQRLMKDYKIFTAEIDRPNVQGCRITPNVFTSTRELDQLVKALTEIRA